MLPIFGLFIFGGFACVLLLSFEYIRFLLCRKTRLPWSRMLGVGWVLFLTGAGLHWYSLFTPQKNYSWQDGWGSGCMGLAFCMWWATIAIYFLTHNRQTFAATTREEPQEDVWPPPPSDGCNSEREHVI